MSPVNLVGWGFAFPALVSAIVFLVSRTLLKRFGTNRAESAAGALAIGLGYIAGHSAVAMPAFPPIDVSDRIPWIVGLALLLELAESLSPVPLWARLENRLLLLAVAILAILGPILTTTAATREGATWLAVIVFVAFLSQMSLDGQSERAPIAATLASRWAILLGTGVCLLSSGSLILGELGLAMAASFGAVAVLTLRSERAAGGPIVGAAAAALLIDGHIYASLPAKVAAVLISAPLIAWIGSIPAVKRLASWKSTLIVLIATSLALGLAIGLALAASPSYEE